MSQTPQAPFDALERFAAALAVCYGIGDVLQGLTDGLTDALDLAGAGVMITLAGGHRARTRTIEATATAELERVDEAAAAGPSTEAFSSRLPVVVADLSAADVGQRWPAYVPTADAAGVAAVAGIPMIARGAAIGVVTLYAAAPRAWPTEDLRLANIFANIATGYLLHAAESEERRRTADQLQQALNSRVIIEQAKGVLAMRYSLTIDDAFQVLRRRSRDSNVRIHDLAHEVVERRGMPDA